MIRTAGTRARRLWLCAAATSLLALPAAAQDGGSQVVNGQLALGDVIANQSLHVQSADDGVAVNAVALGNAATAFGGDQDLSFTSTQRVGGVYVGANPTVIVDGSGGAQVQTTAAATGNAATAVACCGQTSGMTTQTVDGGAIISANGYTQTGGLTGAIATESTAIGNTQGWQAADGAINVQSTQAQGGQVAADTGVAADGGTADEGVHTATATSNEVDIQATSTPVETTILQSMTGDVTHAAVGAYQLGGDQVEAQATSTGNTVTIATDGAVDMYASQDNRGAVEALSDLKLNAWNSASVDADGVGNAILVSNAGPSISLASDQYQRGPVTASATFTGFDGGDGQANATAVGNAVAVYTCASCNGGVQATTTQQTDGAVHATSTVNAGAVNSAFAGASATGNTATFQVRGSGG